MPRKSLRRSGFTLIELLIVIAVIAILALLSFFYIKNAQAKARDTKRMSAVDTYIFALQQYEGVHSTYFITSTADGACNADTEALDPPGHIYAIYGPGCVGKWGNSEGMMSYKGTAHLGEGYSPTTSISDVLIAEGFLTVAPTDPLATLRPNLAKDYYLTLCKQDGHKATTKTGAVQFAVRASLENASSDEVTTERSTCGGADTTAGSEFDLH